MKKIQGVGLGNIFAGGAIQLKKTTVTPKPAAAETQPAAPKVELKPTRNSVGARPLSTIVNAPAAALQPPSQPTKPKHTWAKVGRAGLEGSAGREFI